MEIYLEIALGSLGSELEWLVFLPGGAQEWALVAPGLALAGFEVEEVQRRTLGMKLESIKSGQFAPSQLVRSQSHS